MSSTVQCSITKQNKLNVEVFRQTTNERGTESIMTLHLHHRHLQILLSSLVNAFPRLPLHLLVLKQHSKCLILQTKALPDSNTAVICSFLTTRNMLYRKWIWPMLIAHPVIIWTGCLVLDQIFYVLIPWPWPSTSGNSRFKSQFRILTARSPCSLSHQFHERTLPCYFWDRWPYSVGKLSWDITTQVKSALHPSGFAKALYTLAVIMASEHGHYFWRPWS